MGHQNTSFKLYTHPDSANGSKVLAVSYQLRLTPEIFLINVYQGDGQRPEYLAINPFGKIPALTDGKFILCESNAILQYIVEKYGDFQLFSRDPQKRADIIRWLFWESSHWQPTISSVLASAVGHHLLPNIIPAPTESPNWKNPELSRLLVYLNSHLEHHPFLSNDELTISDISVASMMTYFRFAKFPFATYSALSKWYGYIESLPACLIQTFLKNYVSPVWD